MDKWNRTKRIDLFIWFLCVIYWAHVGIVSTDALVICGTLCVIGMAVI